MFTFEELEENKEDITYSGVDSRDFWYPCIGEAAALLEEEGKICNMSTLKIKLKMLNPEFDEKKLGFKRWSLCVHLASKAGFVQLFEENNQTIIKSVDSLYKTGDLQQSFIKLVSILHERDSNDFQSFALINTKIKKAGINIEKLGFKKFKKYVFGAEVRGLIETKIENNAQYLKAIRSYL